MRVALSVTESDMYDDLQALKIERRDSALWIWMGEGPELDAELAYVFLQAKRDRDVRVIVLTGSREKSFCVGGGGVSVPSDTLAREGYWVNAMRTARELILNALECDKPVVGRINGHAVGKGCSIALCCDITVMVEDAMIGDTHVKVGLAAGDGGSLLWTHLVGLARAKRYLLTGELLTGRQAEAIGLVTEATPRTQLDERTSHWAGLMSRAAPAAVSMTKRALNSALRQQAATHMDMSLGMETLSFLTEDHREGVAALREKREPRFNGH